MANDMIAERIREGKRNRSKILNELLKSPLPFVELQRRVKLSAKTTSGHLDILEKENLIETKVSTLPTPKNPKKTRKYICYAIKQPKTFIEMRKAFLAELDALTLIYWDCLDKETGQLFKQLDEALRKSISQPEQKALKLKYQSKNIPIPNEVKSAKITQDVNLYEKPDIEKLHVKSKEQQAYEENLQRRLEENDERT